MPVENQKKTAFAKRPDSKPLSVARHYVSGELLKSPIDVGDVRDLKIGPEVVFVEVTGALEGGNFKGKIVSFESSPNEDYRGYKTGDTVYFEEAHVWA